jgi:hypothetical protein
MTELIVAAVMALAAAAGFYTYYHPGWSRRVRLTLAYPVITFVLAGTMGWDTAAFLTSVSVDSTISQAGSSFTPEQAKQLRDAARAHRVPWKWLGSLASVALFVMVLSVIPNHNEIEPPTERRRPPLPASPPAGERDSPHPPARRIGF